MKVGRNDPCPCGSGRKYKKCCLPRDMEAQTTRSRYRQVEKSLRDKMLEYHDQERFDWDAEQALDQWYASYGTNFKSKPDDDVRFAVWFIHDYKLSYGKTLLELFYDERRHTLDGLETEILMGWMGTCLGVYEVNRVEEGSGVGLTELFTGEKCFAYDVSASRSLVKWDIILARVTNVGDLCGLEGAGLVYSSAEKETLIRFGEELFRQYRKSRPDASWREFMKEEGIRFNASLGVVKKRFKEMKVLTAEGDEVVFSRAVYRVKDFGGVSAGLERLEELLRVDETGVDSRAGEAHYKWVTPMEEGGRKAEGGGRGGIVLSTDLKDPHGDSLRSLGDIILTWEELTIECLSRQRLEKGKQLLQEALGDSIEHLYSGHQEVGEVLEEREAEKEHRGETKDDGIPPEVSRQILVDSLEDHYGKWVDTPIPALNGVTPREASRTREGRALLEELLKTLENVELRRWKKEGVGYQVDKIRRELYMDRPGLEVISPASFYSKDSEKTKLSWLCYELSMGIYDEIMEEPDEELRRHGIDGGAVAEFSIHISKKIGGSLPKEASGGIEKGYVLEAVRQYFPVLSHRMHKMMFNAVSEAWEELYLACELCPTRCLYDKHARCTMFDKGGVSQLL